MSSKQPLSPAMQDVIRAEIRVSGRITFYRFMELCLYHPQLGYYNSDSVRLGKAGDFYTSAHAAPVFARILARHVERWWKQGKPSRFDLIELGPGDGQLARELLSWIGQHFPEMFSRLRYVGVEQSASLRSRLQEALEPFGGKAKIVKSLEEIAADSDGNQDCQRCVLANEFFDALPVHLLVWRAGQWRERSVCMEGQRLSWCEGEPSYPALAQRAEACFDPGLPVSEREDGGVAEISPLAEEWMERIGRCLIPENLRGELLVIDYGYTTDEWRRGRFPQGSALGYRRHHVVDDLLANPGDQDITAHVNFSQLMEEGMKAGLRVRSLESQARFLMELGRGDEFQEVFADCGSEVERMRRAQLLKMLILPQGMGEAFRVLVMETER